MLPTLALSITLLLAAGALLAWHWSAWKAAREAATEEAERDYAWSQFRRRAQATAMMGVLAALMLASVWLEHMPPWLFAVYIITMLVLVAWIILLALADMVASRQHYALAQTKNFAEQARLKAELYKLKEEAKGDRSRGNGKAKK
jgi:hypothetical protein